jgi:HK97 family phage prohead protease
MPESVDACVKSILADPDFKPYTGQSKKDSAWAICTAKYEKETGKPAKKYKMEETIKKRNIWIPLSKNFRTNEYQAILSDNSIDRDNERMSKDLLIKWSNNPNKFIPMLMDHKNEIMNMVGQWTNPTVISNGDSHALAMTPKWFTSNPNAQIVKGMLDDGANIGLSIGAIPKNSREYKSGDTSCKEWTEAELIEASLVPIGSNRNSFITIAKSFGFNNEEKTMKNEVLRKDLEAEPEAEAEAEVLEEPEAVEETEEEETEVEAEEEAEESVEKSLVAELALLRKEINALKAVKTSRKAVLKALNENSEVVTKTVPQEHLSVWEQIATLKGIKYGEKYW